MDRRKFLKGTGAALAGAAGIGALSPKQIVAKNLQRDIPGYSVSDSDPKPLPTQSNDLSPYTGTWGDTQVRHLVRRTTFGVSYQQFASAKALGSMSALVNKLLEDRPLPAEPGTWCDQLYVADRTLPPDQLQIDFQNKQRLNRTLQASVEDWWFDQMLQEDLSIREKMSLLWSNHFVTGFDSVKLPQYMYVYNQMLRKNALGNLKTFAHDMAINPAMLVFLNGNQNTYQVKGTKIINNVNENFARELMELFTLGIYDPKTGERNYTETDIQQAAKALSGWQPTTTAPFVGQFVANLHDNENKTFFGQTGNWALQDIIDMIFAKNGGYNVAYFICQKIYVAFVYWVPNPQVVDAMANLLISSNWELKPVMSALLSSAHFYDENVPGAQLRSPVEMMGALVREFNLGLPAYNGGMPSEMTDPKDSKYKIYPDLNPTQTYILAAAALTLGQELLNPPNVKGWAGGHSWVNTGTLPTRKSLAYLVTSYPNYFTGNVARAKGVKITFDPLAWAKQIPNTDAMKSAEISNTLTDLFLSFDLGPIEAEVQRSLISGGVPDSDFYLDAAKIAQFTQVLVTLPEYELF
jgi:uncharacterized protein (DUF1800 family)